MAARVLASRLVLLAGALALQALGTTAVAAIKVDSCDATIPANQVGVVQADLECAHHCKSDPSITCQDYTDRASCSAVGGDCIPEQIILQPGAKLRLAGHRIHYPFPGHGVICGDATSTGTCTVIGPGKIVGGQGDAILSYGMDVVVRHLTIDGANGSVTSQGTIVLRHVTVGPNDNGGISSKTRIRANHVVLGSDGMTSQGDISARNVTLESYSGSLLAGGSLRVHHLTFGADALLRGHDVVLDRATPTLAPGAWYLNATADHALRLKRSALALAGPAGPFIGGELYSAKKPVLVDSTCERSFTLPDSTASWNVCAGD